MSIAEKLTTIAENQQRVYGAGYAAGQAEGGGSGDSSVFVGDDSTTVAEYYEAYQAGKMCFMLRSSNQSCWVASACTSDVTYFYNINVLGGVSRGVLLPDGTWDAKNIDTVKTVNGVSPDNSGNVDITLTDEQIGEIVNRVMETMPTWTGGSY